MTDEDSKLYIAFHTAYGKAYIEQQEANVAALDLDACTIAGLRAAIAYATAAPRIVEAVGIGRAVRPPPEFCECVIEMATFRTPGDACAICKKSIKASE